MARRLFIWVGHPRESSLSHALADAYQRGAESAGAEIRRMNAHDMQFDLDLTYGYQQRKEHEPVLTEFLDNTKWAEHLVWAHPLWWGGMPAKMQAVIDRTFLPGITFAYREKGPWWDKLLEGRTADVLVTADTPEFFMKWVYRNPHKNRIKRQILGFTGIKLSRYAHFATAKEVSEDKIEAWKRRAYNMGADAGRG